MYSEIISVISTYLLNHINVLLAFTFIPQLIKLFINNWLYNRINDTNYFILLINPYSQKAMFHGLNCMFTFYWKLNGEYIKTKKVANYLSLTSICFLLTIILAVILKI